MPYTIYTAGPWRDQAIVRDIANRLREAGHTVNSRWLGLDTTITPTPEYMVEQATHDLQDLLDAEALIYVNTGYKSEGKATELGFALGLGKPILIIGGTENNIFLHLPLPRVANVDEAVTWLSNIEEQALNEQLARLRQQLNDDLDGDLRDVEARIYGAGRAAR